MTMVPIEYRDFWDVPRIFVARYRGLTFLFDCPFDESEEDYGSEYRVSILPELGQHALQGSWKDLSKQAVRNLGSVSIGDVQFDPSHRVSIDPGILDRLLSSRLPQSDPLLAVAVPA